MTETIITRTAADEDAETCSTPGCSKPADYHVCNIKDEGEAERYFCEQHGQEYAMANHLVISENS